MNTRASKPVDPPPPRPAGPSDVLILAAPDDVHALAVAAAVDERGGRPVIFDTSEFPARWGMTASYTGGRISAGLRPFAPGSDRTGGPDPASAWDVSWANLSGIWFRRFQPFTIPPAVTDPEVRSFCAGEARDLLFGLLDRAPNIINVPSRESVAGRKPHQLSCAQEAGLRVPDTLISNDPDQIRAFWSEKKGAVVYKILSSTRMQFTETRILREQDLELLAAARHAPTIFQQKLEPKHHLRITIVDDELFVALIRSSRPEATYDWRLDHDHELRRAEIPSSLADRLLTLMRMLGLRYGAADLLVTADGEPWFLEINPSGQFLFAEIDAGFPISRSLASALLQGPARPFEHQGSRRPAATLAP
jgi:hypothetical protein